MKPCSQVTSFGVNFHGFTFPKYALYGSVNGKLYLCTCLFFPKDKKTQYYPIRIWNGFRWEDSTTKEHPDIRHYMSKFMHSDEFQRHKVEYCKHSARQKRRDFFHAKHEIASIGPQKRVIGSYSIRCGSQSMVDGKGYNNSWEENVTMTDPFATCGMPVEYHGNKPSVVQNGMLLSSESFDGLLDDTKKDHLKIDQTKIRPQKNKNRHVIIHINGSIKEDYIEK